MGCKTVACMIKDKSPDEIRKTFNIINDFTSKDENQIRLENAQSGLSLLALPDELINRILKEVPRFDYLKFLIMISDKCRRYFGDTIEKELAIEIGHFGTTKEGAADELSHVLEGWNVENPECEINHCRVDALNSFPGWWPNSWAAPTFITDGYVDSTFWLSTE
jgi:hypothetical protein